MYGDVYVQYIHVDEGVNALNYHLHHYIPKVLKSSILIEYPKPLLGNIKYKKRKIKDVYLFTIM